MSKHNTALTPLSDLCFRRFAAFVASLTHLLDFFLTAADDTEVVEEFLPESSDNVKQYRLLFNFKDFW